MAFTEFYCQSGGSNLNSGSDNGTLVYTSLHGNWVQATGVFTPVDGSNPATASPGVTVGQFASVYIDGATVGVFIGRVTIVTNAINGAITVSTTIKAGAAPANQTGTATIKVGGAWLGPNAASAFPFGLTGFNAAVNSSGDRPRINVKNDQTYSGTSAWTFSGPASTIVQGYSSNPGDGGKATLTNSGASPYSVSTSVTFADLVFAGTIGSGTTDLMAVSGSPIISIYRCALHGARGHGITTATNAVYLDEVEIYDFNKSNTAGKAGISSSGGVYGQNLTIRDSSGGNCDGISQSGSATVLTNCIIHSLGGNGVFVGTAGGGTNFVIITNNDFYNLGGDAFKSSITALTVYHHIKNNNFVKNTGKAINVTTTGMGGFIQNNGYGSGTQANGSADVISSLYDDGTSVTYTSGITPWVDPTTGDFRINSTQANWAGRGAFTQTDSNFGSLTVGYPDIGAAQSKTGGGGTFGKETSSGVAQ